MKKILCFFISLFIVISLSACVTPGSKDSSNSDELYPFRITIDSGKSYKYGYINNKGDIIIKPKYEDAGDYYNGYYEVELNSKWGMINSSGNTVIKPIYQNLGGFCDDLSLAMLNDRYGYIDKKGNVIIPFQFVQATAFSDGRAFVFNGHDWLWIDKKGKVIAKNCENIYMVAKFNNGLAVAAINDKYGYIDTNFKFVIEPKYKYAGDFVNGFAVAEDSKDKFYFINTKGEKTFDSTNSGYSLYNHTEFSDNGLITVKKNGKVGYMDVRGNIKIDCIFDDAQIFVDGHAIVIKDGKKCVIDEKGKILTDSLPKTINMVIIGELVGYEEHKKGTVYYTLTGKKIFSSAGD